MTLFCSLNLQIGCSLGFWLILSEEYCACYGIFYGSIAFHWERKALSGIDAKPSFECVIAYTLLILLDCLYQLNFHPSVFENVLLHHSHNS